MSRLLRIGTRGSTLALAQAAQVKAALEKVNPGWTCELTVIKTSGDDFTAWKKSSPEASGPGGVPLKGLFVKEIEEALLEKRIDLAVHSVKDLQADLPAELKLAGVLKRQDPRDALVATKSCAVGDLPAGTTVGVSSLRRQSQLKKWRRDLEVVPIRGNVDTRLAKLDAGEYGALILAACGLTRLGLTDRISEFLDPLWMVPSAGQGALGMEIRAADEETAGVVQAVNDPDSFLEIQAERALLKALGGGCQVPIGALARIHNGNMVLLGVVLSPDGMKAIRKEVAGPKPTAERLGKELASHLRAAGADRLLYGHWASKAT